MDTFKSFLGVVVVAVIFAIGDVIMGQPSIIARLTLCASLLVVILVKVSRK